MYFQNSRFKILAGKKVCEHHKRILTNGARILSGTSQFSHLLPTLNIQYIPLLKLVLPTAVSVLLVKKKAGQFSVCLVSSYTVVDPSKVIRIVSR